MLLGFASLCLFMASWAFFRPDRLLQLPFLSVLVFLGWLFPQFLGLTSLPLPEGALDKAIFMAILSMCALSIGYQINRRSAKLFTWAYDYNKLIVGATGFAVVGSFAFYLVSQLAPFIVGEWTGPITIFVFFSQFLSFALALSLLLYLTKKSYPALALVTFSSIFYLDRIFIHGRRSDSSEFILIFLLALWFKRSWIPPRAFFIIIFVLGALFVNSAGDYRNLMLQGVDWTGASFNEVMQIDFIGNLMKIAAGDSYANEATNALMNIHSVDQTMILDYGISQWNGLVFRYIPAQIVGSGFKDFLTIPLADSAKSILGYIPYDGSTPTGLSDSFKSFWYFGAFNFFLIGFIMSRWYLAAVQGHLAAQLIVILSTTKALHAITHSTDVYFSYFIQLFLCLIPVLWLSRSSKVLNSN